MISLIDTQSQNAAQVLAPRIPWGVGLAFSEHGHVLGASDISQVTQFWDVDSGRHCILSGRTGGLIFYDAAGLVLSTSGNRIDLRPWSGSGCPTWAAGTGPLLFPIALNAATNVAYGVTQTQPMFLGSGYAPAKVTAFKPLDGSIIRGWVLPYPESEQGAEALAIVDDDTLMISQWSRIVLHDASTMRIKDVLGARAVESAGSVELPTQNAIYLSVQNAIYASARGGTVVVKWKLK